MSNLSLGLTFSMVLLAMFFSYKGKIGLEKDLLISSLRAVVQLAAVGYALKYVFKQNNFWFTSVILLVMVYNAALIAAKRGEGIKKGRIISFVAILVGLAVTLGALVLFGSISYKASQAIPISGMVVGNAMIAIGLVFRQMKQNYQTRKDEVEVKLSLGAPPREASAGIIRESIKTAMVPTVDSMKTLGIVQLPGMMTGLILAGTSPEVAIKFQIMVAFMLSGAVAIATFLASFMAYNSFFTGLAQLRDE